MITVAITLGASDLYLYCNYGKLASHSFEIMANTVYESNWIELSNDLKKYVVLMIAIGQKPMQYHGFGIIVLNMETFTRVSLIVHLKWIDDFIISLIAIGNLFFHVAVYKNSRHILYDVQNHGRQVLMAKFSEWKYSIHWN